MRCFTDSHVRKGLFHTSNGKQNNLQAGKQQEVGVAVPSLAEEVHLAQNLRFLNFPSSPRADSLAVNGRAQKKIQ